MSPGLFDPLKLKSIELQNRIVVSPMCQYSAKDGCAGDWHTMHIGQFAVSNPGLIFMEGTAVEARGRISKGDLCLYTDEQEAAVKRIIAFVREHSQTRIGVQLFHSGRKGSQVSPCEKSRAPELGETLLPEDGGWPGCAPSPLRFDENYPCPREATHEDLRRIKNAFVESATRAARAGFDTIEIHYAHGYLLHSFLSSVSNQRSDSYGGSLENRMRFPLDVFEAVRAIWPESRPLGARISGTDHGLEDNAWTLDDAANFAQALKTRGCDYLDVSSGFLSPNQKIEGYGPGFQVNLAARIREETNLPIFTVGVVVAPKQADEIIRTGQADAVALARGMVYDPRWPWHAAHELGATAHYPPQYERTFTHHFPETFAEMNKQTR